MKTIIAGSRSITDFTFLVDAVREFDVAKKEYKITEVVCGGAKGVDKLGALWGARHNIPIRLFPADWDRYGRKAGILRNEEMAEYADAAIILWNGKSSGTKNMIDLAKQYKLVTVVFRMDMNESFLYNGECDGQTRKTI